MTIASHPSATAPIRSGAASFSSSLKDAAIAWCQRMHKQRRARSSYCDLSGISASTLKDIGIRRCEKISLTLGDVSGPRR